MKILVFGRSGQVATELQRLAPDGVELTALGRAQADLADPQACARIVSETDADAIINAAAYTAVDRAEQEEALAELVNGQAPALMARAAAARNIPFLHISTDYVFDGSGTTPWKPDDATAPLNAYGRTKLHGEEGIIAAGGQSAILRTSWVFSAHGGNFVKTMLRLGRERPKLTIVADQIGGPTSAADIADTLLRMAAQMADDSHKSGIFHFSGAPDASWAQFAREIFLQAGLAVDVGEIATRDYPTPAARPANSRLDCASLQKLFGIERSDWRNSLRKVLNELSRTP